MKRRQRLIGPKGSTLKVSPTPSSLSAKRRPSEVLHTSPLGGEGPEEALLPQVVEAHSPPHHLLNRGGGGTRRTRNRW